MCNYESENPGNCPTCGAELINEFDEDNEDEDEDNE